MTDELDTSTEVPTEADAPADEDAEATTEGSDPLAGVPRVMSVAEAAAWTNRTPKAIRNRIDRGQLQAVKNSAGKNMIPAAELARVGLLTPRGNPGEAPGVEVVRWQDLYEREHTERESERERLTAEVDRLRGELTAERAQLATAGWLRIGRLRRAAKARLIT